MSTSAIVLPLIWLTANNRTDFTKNPFKSTTKSSKVNNTLKQDVLELIWEIYISSRKSI